MFQFPDIPKIFYNSDTNQPFNTCLVCGRFLLGGDCNYVIEKAFRKYKDVERPDIIFEYAMCLDCLEELNKSFSEVSRKRLDDFWKDHIKNRDFEDPWGDFDVDDRLSKCFFKGTGIDELEEYQICGQFTGNRIIPYIFPFMIGYEAMDEMMELLSNETLDEIDGFTGRYLGPPEDIKNLFRKPRPVFI